MSNTSYDIVKELVNQYNTMFMKHGIEVTMHRRSFTEEVKNYNYYGQHSLLNFLEYRFINKKIENKKYRYAPNRFKLLVLQIKPLKPTSPNKKDFKTYAFLVHKISRAHIGDKPTELQYNEEALTKKTEKRLKRLLKRAEKSKSSDFCFNTMWDSLRYSTAGKYKFIENFCGKSRFFWEVVWICVFAAPVFLFVIGGLIHSLIQ